MRTSEPPSRGTDPPGVGGHRCRGPTHAPRRPQGAAAARSSRSAAASRCRRRPTTQPTLEDAARLFARPAGSARPGAAGPVARRPGWRWCRRPRAATPTRRSAMTTAERVGLYELSTSWVRGEVSQTPRGRVECSADPRRGPVTRQPAASAIAIPAAKWVSSNEPSRRGTTCDLPQTTPSVGRDDPRTVGGARPWSWTSWPPTKRSVQRSVAVDLDEAGRLSGRATAPVRHPCAPARESRRSEQLVGRRVGNGPPRSCRPRPTRRWPRRGRRGREVDAFRRGDRRAIATCCGVRSPELLAGAGVCRGGSTGRR